MNSNILGLAKGEKLLPFEITKRKGEIFSPSNKHLVVCVCLDLRCGRLLDFNPHRARSQLSLGRNDLTVNILFQEF